nr:hypothetical protein Iba_chr03cCG1720 [Ipomoea batatas]
MSSSCSVRDFSPHLSNHRNNDSPIISSQLSDDITDYLKDRGPKPPRWIGILGSDITMLFENLLQYRSSTGFHLIAVNIHLFAIKDWESRDVDGAELLLETLRCSTSCFNTGSFIRFSFNANPSVIIPFLWLHQRIWFMPSSCSWRTGLILCSKCTGSIFMGRIVSHIYVVLVDLVTAKLCIARCILARNLGQIRGWSFSRAITA